MLAFIHTQKTAGTTAKWILRSSFGMRHCDIPWYPQGRSRPVFDAADLGYLRRFYPHLESIKGHSVVPWVGLDSVCPGIEYFTLMRDPIKRSASWFQYHVQRGAFEGDDFDDWIKLKDRHNLQTQMISGKADADAAIQMIRDKSIFVGLVERFDESMLLLKALVARSLNIAYERRNVARNNTVAERLLQSERTRGMLVDINQEDLKLYNYVKQELYPTYLQEYGHSLQVDLERYRASQDTFNYLNVNLSRLKQRLWRPLFIRASRSRTSLHMASHLTKSYATNK